MPVHKIVDWQAALRWREELTSQGQRVSFTNGCYDLLHPGHIRLLTFARRMADALIVAINSDNSVRRLKGEGRPLNQAQDRAVVLAALEAVDRVVIFEQDEPADLVRFLTPDVLVKGADWAHYISGREHVEATGGRVVTCKLMKGYSTSEMLTRLFALEPQEGGRA
jgi:D-beta-D-heptose 7-phosphate kinase/D-beta-D-heptose 1-phosphate adenosyltransferase